MADIANSSMLQKMKVADLKKLLKEKHLSTVGNKAELIARLETGGGGTNGADHLNASHEDEEDLLEDDEDDLCGASELMTEELDASLPVSPVVPKKPQMSDKTMTKTAVATGAPVVPKPKITKIEVAPVAAKPAVAGKMEDRLKRFGVVSEDVKKQVRADRFQTSSTDKVKPGPTTAAEVSATVSTKKTFTPVVLASTTVVEDQARLKKRSERFGSSTTPATATSLVTVSATSVAAPSLAKTADLDTLKKRAERFGQLTSTSLTKVVEQERVLKRKGRFGTILAPANAATDSGSDAKKMKRAERFGAAAPVTSAL